MRIITETTPRPGLAIVYGEPGIGKTTLAARCAQHVPTLLLDLEDRPPRDQRVDRVIIEDWASLRDALREARGLDYRLVAVDTIDRAQDYCVSSLCQARGWDTLEAPGYGRGYVELRQSMLALADDIEALRQSGRAVLLLAHAQRQRVEDPVYGEWDRWTVRLHDAARSSVAAVYIERADLIALAACAVTRVGDESSRRARLGGRMLYCTPHAGRLTKSVYGPEDMPLDDAPARLVEWLCPQVSADADECRRIAQSIAERIGGREALKRLLRERGFTYKAMSLDDWQRLDSEIESIPE